MLNCHQFRDLIVKPALNDLVMQSDEAVELLLFTCAAESNAGMIIKQFGGDGLGIYHMKPSVYIDIWENYLKNKTRLLLMLLSNFNIVFMPSEERLIYDLRFATAMARIFYERIKERLPDPQDVNAIWNYYSNYYNTQRTNADKERCIKTYKRFKG